MKDREINTELRIENEDGVQTLVRDTFMKFDDLGYHSQNIKKQTFIDKEKLSKEIEDTESRNITVQTALDQNDAFLEDKRKLFEEVWNSAKYKTFIRNFDKMIEAKKEQEKYVEKSNQQRDFKEELKNNKEVLKLYKEMLEKWE